MQALRPKLWAPLVLVLGGVGAFAASQGAPVEAADHNDPPNRVHNTASPSTDDREADIADVFAWTSGTGAAQRTTLALTFDGPNTPAALTAMPCDPDVLYQIHITADGGICPVSVFVDPDTFPCNTPSAGHPCGQYTPTGGSPTDCSAEFGDMHTINVRFAPNGAASTATCVVQAEFAGLDGATPIAPAPVVGAVETNITAGMVSLHAGLHDDAFFFDLAGFQQLLATGMLSSLMGNDSFAGLNTPVIVIEFPTSAITHSTHSLFAPTSPNAIRVWASTSRFQPHT